MHDSPPDRSYEELYMEPISAGDGACAFFASDADGDTAVVSCTYNIGNDDLGRAHRDTNVVVRARAGLRALMAARQAAGGQGLNPA